MFVILLKSREAKLSFAFCCYIITHVSQVTLDERIRLDISSHQAHFYNKRAKRSDTGTYNIQLTNTEGSDQASCKVLVVDRPSPPSQPIDAYDITPETCTLSWRPPQDDGGSPVTNYVVERYDVSGGFW